MSKKQTKNYFIRFRKWLEGPLSNKVKKSTNSDLFDWLSLGLWAIVSLILTIFLVNVSNISDLVTMLILWFTAFAVVRYTKETYYLKKLAQKQLGISEQTQMNEFLPIVITGESGILQGDSVNGLSIQNIGKGVAKDVCITLGSVDVMKSFNVLPQESKPVNIEFNKDNIKKKTEQEKDPEIYMEITYRDIYERRFRTVEIVFNRDEDSPHNRYRIYRGKWRFQKLS